LILDEIAKEKRIEVEAKKKAVPIPVSRRSDIARDFTSAIRRSNQSIPNVIAEVKRASPSKGVIREDFQPVDIAKGYESAGASAISVLTDVKFFQGSLAYLTDCRSAVSIPVLRKDFIIDSYQIEEAQAAGADAILLIAALLDTDTLHIFRKHADSLGMASLVEVHDETELDSALESGANVIGINNRNLQTFQVDLETTFRLLPRIPKDKVIVSESGIATREDLLRLADVGVDAVLVGETFMKAPSPGEKLRELIR
jgi:indole-3-glycerol phosphate synthase